VRSACFVDLVGRPAQPGWRNPFWTEVKCIPKWFMKARDQISTGDENLRMRSASVSGVFGAWHKTHPFESRRTRPGMGSNKDWLLCHCWTRVLFNLPNQSLHLSCMARTSRSELPPPRGPRYTIANLRQ